VAGHLDDEADRLYALPAAGFIAARDERARELRGEDPELASAVAALRKPSAAAAAVNAIARADPDGVAELAELGARLRAAQDEGDGRALAALVRERRELVRQLLGAAPPVSAAAREEAARTLEAATVDPWAAQAVAGGRLLRALTAVGFDPVDLDGAVATVPASGSDGAGTTPPGGPRRLRSAGADAKREAARREADEAADAAARDAREAADDLAAAVTAARDTAEQADAVLAELAELEQRAAGLRDRRDDLERRRRSTARDRDEAEATARSALGRLESARRRAAELAAGAADAPSGDS
jgi:hypothetical protein